MTDTKQVMQQALDALCLPCDRWNGEQTKIINAAIEALRGCLTAPAAEVPEVWGWAILDKDGLTRSDRARFIDFFGSALEVKPTTEADAKRADEEWPGCAPHRVVTLYTAAPQAPALDAGVVRDAERYRWIAAHCRSTAEHWGGRWSIVVEGPEPKTHDSEDDFDAAIDAAMSSQAGGDK